MPIRPSRRQAGGDGCLLQGDGGRRQDGLLRKHGEAMAASTVLSTKGIKPPTK